MANIKNLASSLGLKVSTVEVAEMNPVIFKTKVVGAMSGLTKDGDNFYMVDTKKNIADVVTADSIKTAAIAGLTAKEATPFGNQAVAIAESYGLIKKVTLVKDAEANNGSTVSLNAVLTTLNLKVAEVDVSAQHEVIFKTKVLAGNLIQGLTQDEGQYYEIDTKKNTATIINPEIVATKAKEALLKGKPNDFSKIAETFGLINSITLVAKGKDEE